jgi:glycosyltransferase involved in cell wall biosynthesis
MKILFLLRSLNIGGVETQLVVLAKGLHKRGHHVLVATFYPGGPLEDELRGAGVLILPLHKRGRWDIVRFLLRFVKILRKESPDILHSYLYEPNLVALMVKPILNNTKLIWGVATAWMDLTAISWLDKVSLELNRLLSGFPAVIVSNSQAGRDYHLSLGWPAEKMLIVRNGIDVDRFRLDPEARVRIRSEWRIAEGQKLIGMAARLDPVKDHPIFLQAAASLARKWKNVRFVCIGDGPEDYRRKLREMGIKLGLEELLIWAGARGDMPAVYNALDIAVNSSYCEGLSNVIGEAMACGVRCVVTNVGDSAWVVGDLGEVVPPKNSLALADAIQKLLNQKTYDPAQIRRRIVEQLSVNSLVINTEDVLSNLLQSPLKNVWSPRA